MQFTQLCLQLLLVVVLTKTQSSEEGLRLIKTSDKDPGHWVTEDEKNALIRNGIKFFDITNLKSPLERAVVNEDSIPTVTAFETIVREAFADIQNTRIQEFLVSFTRYHNRYYNSSTGVDSAEWLLAQVENSITSANYGGNVSVHFFNHTGYSQPSVIARINGSATLGSEVVILGAHLDSINTEDTSGIAPGADDNGSGCAVLLEVFRVLLAKNFIPQRSIEFQWYAAEEDGLQGSLEVASTYQAAGVQVAAMVNMDVVGFSTWIESIGLHIDYTSEKLNQFLRTLIAEYLSFTTTNLMCEYGCSDHASFHQCNFPAAFPSEAINTFYMHTENDVVSTVNITFVNEFTKLGLAYVIEVSDFIGSGSSAAHLNFSALTSLLIVAFTLFKMN